MVLAGLLIVGLAAGLGSGLVTRPSSATKSTGSGQPALTTNSSPSTGSLWQPAVGTSWQIILQGPLTESAIDVDVYDIDLFDNEASIITWAHSKNRKVICYFSAGSYEDWRPDAGSFKPGDYGNALDGWEGENWLNTKSANARDIMLARVDLAAEKGCDGIDPDNIDGYGNDNGLGLTKEDAVDYVTFLADAARARNMSMGLKNGAEIMNQVLDIVQWDVVEQCLEYQECASYKPFINAGKPVFQIEYPTEGSSSSLTAQRQKGICGDAGIPQGFSTVLKNMNLDEWIETCP